MSNELAKAFLIAPLSSDAVVFNESFCISLNSSVSPDTYFHFSHKKLYISVSKWTIGG